MLKACISSVFMAVRVESVYVHQFEYLESFSTSNS